MKLINSKSKAAIVRNGVVTIIDKGEVFDYCNHTNALKRMLYLTFVEKQIITFDETEANNFSNLESLYKKYLEIIKMIES